MESSSWLTCFSMEVTDKRMPLVSAIVPIYNVERYLRVALESLASQTHTNLEVVMVDDGSTDGSALIAKEFAARDERFLLISQENGGLSKARNVGIRHATGDYLTFFDSDDISPHYAFRSVIRTLEQTGSDFLSGRVVRLDSRGTFDVPMQSDSHAKSILSTTVEKTPALMRDFLAGNKFYRRRFWDAAGLEFPDGLTFEDGPVSVRAHALAHSVDVVRIPTCYWRMREVGTGRSISQQNTEAHFFTDRIETSLLSIDFLSRERPDLLGLFYAEDIGHKFVIMYRYLAATSPEVRGQFMDRAADYLERAPEEVIDGLPPELRQRILLTKRGDLSGLMEDLQAAVPPAPDRGRPSILRAHFRPPGEQGDVHGAVSSVELDGDQVRIIGFGHLAGLPAEGRLTAANRAIWATHDKSGTKHRVPFQATPSPQAAASQPEHAEWSAGYAGYDARLDLGMLKKNGRWLYGIWRLTMTAMTPRGLCKGPLAAGSILIARDLRPIDVDADVRIIPIIEDGALILRVKKTEAMLTGCRADGGDVVLSGLLRGKPTDGARLQLRRISQVAEVSVPLATARGPKGFATFTARLPMSQVLAEVGPATPAPVSAAQNRLYFNVVLPGQADRSLPADFRMGTVSLFADGQRLDIAVDHSGKATATLRPALPTMERVRWGAGGTLEISGSGGRPYGLVVRHNRRREERLVPIEAGPDGTWSARLDPTRVPVAGTVLPLRPGTWRFVLRTRDYGDVDFPHAGEALAELGARDGFHVAALSLDRLVLQVLPRLGDDERGAFNQRILREVRYPRLRDRPLREAILYSSFGGKKYSGAPRALYELLSAGEHAVEHVWVTSDGQAPLPEGVRSVELMSRGWYEALATSRHIVTDVDLPDWFVRRKGQTVTHTGDDPTIGRPESDLLVNGDLAEIAAAVRRELNIPAGKHILLYAPTRRPYEHYGSGRYRFALRLEPAKFTDALREEYVLLVRRHPEAIDDLLGMNDDFVVDVANYPDVNRLLAAADVLVTDYSSVAATFLNTARPVLFYAYDLDEERDFDPPGPVLRTTEEIVDALSDLDAVKLEYSARYAAFGKDDGQATARLAARLFAK